MRTRLLSDLLSVLAAIPPLVWVPMSLAAFGLHEWAFTVPGTVFAAALLAPSVVVQVKTAPDAAIATLRVLGHSRREINRLVYIPHIFGGMAPHVALAFALLFGMSAVVEYLAGFDGIGRVLRSLSFAYEMRDLLLVTLVSTAILWAVQTVLRRALLSLQSWL